MSKEKIAIIGFLFMSLSYSQVNEMGCLPDEDDNDCYDRVEYDRIGFMRYPECPPSEDINNYTSI